MASDSETPASPKIQDKEKETEIFEENVKNEVPSSESDEPRSSEPPAEQPGAQPWQAVFSPQHNAYYFYNVQTGEVTWTNPLVPPEPSVSTGPAAAAGQSSTAPLSPTPTYGVLEQAAIAHGIDPGLAYLDPSLLAPVPGSSSLPGAPPKFTAQFNARTGAFTAPTSRTPGHLSETERAKRMSEFYFDVNAWENQLAEHGGSIQGPESESKKRKKPSKKDLERFKEQKRQKKIAKTAWLLYHKSREVEKAVPPGPKGWPLIRNILDVSTKQKQWKLFAEWAQKWGPVMSVSFIGQRVILISKMELIHEFEKKGAVFSGRPRFVMAGEPAGFQEILLFQQYGPRMRTARRQIVRAIGPGMPVESLRPTLENEVLRFVKRLVKNPSPDELYTNIRRYAQCTLLQTAYGHSAQEDNDPIIDLVEKSSANLVEMVKPGAYLVDFIPVLAKLPRLLPGMTFLDKAEQVKKFATDTRTIPFANEEEGDDMLPQDIHDLKLTAGMIYGAGSDTTASSEYAFFLAMSLYPDVQQKAQAELQSIVEESRLPSLSYRNHLPYINALILEVLRWFSVVPLPLPHVATEDSDAAGYFIPKGSFIIPNQWAMHHDPEVYPDPFTFDPERFIEAPGKEVQQDPRKAASGFRRRVCPGIALAEASIFHLATFVLTVFNIEKALDENGVPITPTAESTNSMSPSPLPFKCAIKVQSEKALALVEDVCQ